MLIYTGTGSTKSIPYNILPSLYSVSIETLTEVLQRKKQHKINKKCFQLKFLGHMEYGYMILMEPTTSGKTRCQKFSVTGFEQYNLLWFLRFWNIIVST